MPGGPDGDVADFDVIDFLHVLTDRSVRLLAASADGRIPAGSRVVCTITGNGLKDPDWALSGAPAPITVPVDAATAAAALGLA